MRGAFETFGNTGCSQEKPKSHRTLCFGPHALCDNTEAKECNLLCLIALTVLHS